MNARNGGVRTDWRRPSLSWAPAVAFWVLVLVYAGYAFTVPVFATGDGAGHVYWADVLANRLANTAFYPEFEIRQYLPPYALTSYYLAFAQTFLSGAMAEKTLVALCIVTLCAGVRRLAGTVSDGASWASLLIVPFCFNSLLFAGFYNFCLGAGLAAWVAAYWLNNHRRMTGRQAGVFLALLALLYLAHPFSLAVGLLFCGLHLAFYLLRATGFGAGRGMKSLRAFPWENRWAIASLWAGALLARIVTAFIWPAEEWPDAPTWTGLTDAVSSLWHMKGLVAHSVQSGWLARLVLFAIALGLAVAGLAQSIRRRAGWNSGFLFAFALLMFFLYAWAPEGMTTAVLVAQRFTVFLMIFLVAAAARFELSRWTGATIGVVIVALSLVAFYDDVRIHRAAAEANRVLVEAPVLKPGARGAMVMDGWERASSPGASYWSCLWSPAHYFQRSRATLLNAPWYYEQYSILQIREWREYWGLEATRMGEKLVAGLDNPQDVPMPEKLELLIGADCSSQPSDDITVRRLAERYGLVKMPWSTEAYSFYVAPGWEVKDHVLKATGGQAAITGSDETLQQVFLNRRGSNNLKAVREQ